MKHSTYYHTCEYCGSNLDPGEKCDCRQKDGKNIMGNYVEALNTAVFNKAWTPLFMSLSDENAGRLIKAIFDFMNGDEITIEDDQLKAIFLYISDQIEINAQKYYSKVNQEGR